MRRLMVCSGLIGLAGIGVAAAHLADAAPKTAAMTVTVSPTKATAGAATTYGFTFKAGAPVAAGTATLTIPAGWTAPTLTAGNPGAVSVSKATCSGASLGSPTVNGNGSTTLTISAITCNNAGSFSVSYANARALVAGAYPFPATLTVNSSLTNLTAPVVTINAGPPATVQAVAGSTPQSQTVASAFASPFAALVKDASGNVLSGVTVKFTAPSSGASGTFAGSRRATESDTTNASGVATSSTFTANTTAGTYNVVGSVTGATSANFALTNNPVSVTVVRDGNGSGSVSSTPSGISCGATCTAPFAYNGAVTLNATASSGSHISAWNGGGCSGTSASCTINHLTASTTVTVTFTLDAPTLTLSSSGTGSGTFSCTVNGGPSGACASSYNSGDAVVITATADTGSTFTGWSTDCSGTSTCSLSMTANRTVDGAFTLQTRSLTLSSSGTGSGTFACVVNDGPSGACASSYNYGDAVVITATADTGSDFTGWSTDCSGTSTCSLSMTDDRTVDGAFTLQTRSLTLSASGTGSGTFACVVNDGPSGDCTDSYNYGDAVVITATADTGSDFTGWSTDCSGTSTCSLSMTDDRTVDGAFTLQTRSFTLSSSGTGSGTFACVVNDGPSGACTDSYNFGDAVVITATPDTGSDFTGWSTDCSGTSTCSLSMTDDRTVDGAFTLQTRSLTLSASGTGSGTFDCVVNDGPSEPCTDTYNYDESVVITATPDTGSDFTGWSTDCSGTSTCSLSMTDDRTVDGAFTLQTRSLTLSSSGTGSGTFSCTVNDGPSGTCASSYDYGDAVVITASANTGSTFTGWSTDCSGTSTCSLSMTDDRTVDGAFTLQTRSLTLSSSGTGSGTFSCTVNAGPSGACASTYDYGAAVVITASASGGSTFTGWSGDCTGTSTCSLTMSANHGVTGQFTAAITSVPITNPGFETGDFTGWTTVVSSTCISTGELGGCVGTTAMPAPSITNVVLSGVGGTHSALLGETGNYLTPEGKGYVSVSQTVTLPATGTTTLSFYYLGNSADRNALAGEGGQQALIEDANGVVLSTVYSVADDNRLWTHITRDLSTSLNGQTVQLVFRVFEDGGVSPTGMYLDNVSLSHTG